MSTRLLAWCPQVPSWILSSRALPSSSSMHLWSIWVMLRLYSCLLITVNALDRRLMRRASATSCGSVPLIKNRRNGFVQTGPSNSVGVVLPGVLVLVPSDGVAAATCVIYVASLSSTTASGVAACTLMDLHVMLSRKTPGGTGARVEPMFASSSASVLLSLVM